MSVARFRFFSDPHIGDPDLRVVRYGTTGFAELESFVNYSIVTGARLVDLGDLFNAKHSFWKDLPTFDRMIGRKLKPGHQLGVAGNHDHFTENVGIVGHRPGWVGQVQVRSKAGELYTIRYEHGSRADKIFADLHNDHKPPFRRALARLFTDEVIKRGYQAELHIHPMIDEWIIGGLHSIQKRFVPAGGHLNDDHLIEWVRDETFAGGGVRWFVNTGAWVPYGEDSELGWYVRKQVVGFYFDTYEKALCAWSSKHGPSIVYRCGPGNVAITGHTHRPTVREII